MSYKHVLCKFPLQVLGINRHEPKLLCTVIVSNHPSETSYGAFDMHHAPARVAIFHSSPLLVVSTRAPKSLTSPPRWTLRLEKQRWLPRNELYFLCICITLVVLISLSRAITDLIFYILLLLQSGHQFIHSCCLAVRTIQCNIFIVCFRAGLLKRLMSQTIKMTSQWLPQLVI